LYLQTRKPGANLPSSSALLRVLVALRLVFEIPYGTSPHSSLATNHCCKIKNPASSAGLNRHIIGGFARCSISFYPVLVENPTIGSTARLRLFLRWEDFLRSDRDAPEQSATPESPRTRSNDTSFSAFVKPSLQLFFHCPHRLVDIPQAASRPPGVKTVSPRPTFATMASL